VAIDFGCEARCEFRVERGVRLQLGELSLDPGRELKCLVLPLELVDVLSFKVCVGLKAEPQTSESRVGDREEDAANIDDIAGRH
jgi:hypothetical protein